MQNSRCKICRRAGVKLFLKGERCFSPKCSMIKRSYPPGEKGKRRKRMKALSEYGKELKEKQKLKNLYNLREDQFRKYVKEVLGSRGRAGKDPQDLLINLLEGRLDNVIFRAGITPSRIQAHQLVSHSHFLVNGKPVNVSSYQVKKGDIVKLKPKSLKKNIFQNLLPKLKKQKTPSWLTLDSKNLEIKIIGASSVEEVAPPVEIPVIFEYYSR